MTMKAHGMHCEDVRLARVFPQAEGFYIDIGAGHPRRLSNTWHFYQRGWRGIVVEPRSGAAELFQRERPRDIFIEAGLSDRDGVRPFVEIGGLSTFSIELAILHRDVQNVKLVPRIVPVTTLTAVCAANRVTSIDFISMDVEEGEFAVIAGCDWATWRPRVLVIEAVRPFTYQPTHKMWESLLTQAGYLFATSDAVNRFYVREEDRHLIEPLARPLSEDQFCR